MASIRNLKKNTNEVMAAIIEAAYVHQMVNTKADEKEIDAIVDDAVESYDELISKINNRDVENRAQHLKKVNAELEEKANELVGRLNKLGA